MVFFCYSDKHSEMAVVSCFIYSEFGCALDYIQKKKQVIFSNVMVMEWNGIEWDGMEWNGMEWNRVQCNALQCNVM